MRISGAIADVLVALPSVGSFRSPEFKHSHAFSPVSKLLLPSGFTRSCPFHSLPKLGNGLDKSHGKGFTVRALSSPGGDSAPVAPVQFDSPIGQLLAQILQTHPHLLPATIDQQLENLQAERDAQKEESLSRSQDLLYKRIAEVKEKDRRKTLEEIMYCLIVQKFIDSGIKLIPKISATSDPTGRVDFWPNQEQKLESVHSSEAFEMIQSHLSLVLGEREVGPLSTIVQISKIKLGKLYAASVMYGYFLKRVDERFQLERSMNTLPKGFKEQQLKNQLPESPFWDPESLIQISGDDEEDEEDGGRITYSGDTGPYRLRSYVMYLDADTLQRYATIRSKEAISLIEKQTQALFGRPDIRISEDGSLDASNDEVIAVTFSGLTMLVLEAVAFGSFLWDAEGYIESKYSFLKG